ncbi:hypothetical protein [Paenibacillus agricola]|uniref:Uncharacterized protein n=1 Tax=Paenibacillus agricola TaxID=2716264 RepID=A0ABX0JCA0_9BACL|nr:hypothetical protein [Paenibacillus agricola]NHN33578.1 hypothetical protein [Paenibacillus agricola]
MIAILHVDGFVRMLIPDLISIDGGNVTGVDSAARGTTADILVVDGFTHSEDETGQFITNGSTTIRLLDAINPSDFTDTRAQLPLTPEQQKDQRIAQLEEENIDNMLALVELYEMFLGGV